MLLVRIWVFFCIFGIKNLKKEKLCKMANVVLGVVYFDQRMHAFACIWMVESYYKCLNKIKNILFSSCVREAYVRLMYKYEQILSFLAFRSDSKTLVATQKLVAPERFWLKSNNLTHEPLMSMMKRGAR